MTRWLLVAGDFTALGGMDRANHALARYLATHGREVHVVAHRVSADLARLPGLVLHEAPRPLGAHLLGAPALAREAAAVAQRLGPDTRVFVNGGNTALEAPSWLHYLHAAYEPRACGSIRTRVSAAIGRRVYLRAEDRAVRRAPVLVANSHRTADDLDARYGPRLPRTEVVYYGTDASTFKPVDVEGRCSAKVTLGVPPDRRLALFVGALGDRRKGFDVVFDAWQSLVRDAAWDVDLAVAGMGGELAAWRRRAHATGLGTRVHFLGFRSDVPSAIAAADVLVHPARYEAYGLGVHEAICCDVPAIVTANAGIAERYPKELSGLLLPEGATASQLATALRAWRGAETCWRERVRPFGRALRQRSWDDMAADIAAIVEAAA